jgi:cysteine synthase A
MLPDTGERYLSTPLFADIDAEMDADEWAISRSTPLARFDAASQPPPAAAAPALPDVKDYARVFVEDTIASPAHPIVMFALEWCEFCWTLRRFFRRIGGPVHAIDLDAPQWQGRRGSDVRAALLARTGQPTIPQVFVVGEWLGGCMDTLAAWRTGRLQRMLRARGVRFDADAIADPHSLLPAWLQPRTPALQ